MRLQTFMMCAAALALAGCESPNDFGNAVRQNIAADVTDPNATRHDQPQTMEGARAAIAQQRYVSGKTIVPEDPNTGAEAGSSGSGSGSSSDSSSSTGTGP